MDAAELAKLAAGIKKGNNAGGDGATGKGYSGIFEKKPKEAKLEPDRLKAIPPVPEAGHKPAQAACAPTPAAAGAKPGGHYTAMFQDVRDGAHVPSFPAAKSSKQKTDQATGGCGGCTVL